MGSGSLRVRTAAPTPAPRYRSGALASHPSGRSLNLPATLCSSVNRRYGIPLQGAAAISEMNIRKVSGTLGIVLHLAPPERRPEGVEAPDRGGRRVERGQGMQRPVSRLRRTPQAPAPRGGPGHARGSGLGRRTRPNHLGHRFQPAGTSRPQVKLSRLLTSDSRRWLLNASRPLGAACFPLPPPLPLPLPLPLAGGLPAPGAAESSMRLWSAAPLRGSAISAPGDPTASRREPGPAPSTAIGCSRLPQPRPAAQLAVLPLRAGLEEVGAHSRDFFFPCLFFCPAVSLAAVDSWLSPSFTFRILGLCISFSVPLHSTPPK